MIDHYGAEIQKQNLQLSEKAKDDERVKWLLTIPGIGEGSAMMLLAEIGDLGRFGNKAALCSYAGLVPRVRESAGKAARGGITLAGIAVAALDHGGSGAGGDALFPGRPALL